MINKEEQYLMGHLIDLSNVSYFNEYPCYSDFLTMSQQNDVLNNKKSFSLVDIDFLGGIEEAERKIVCFYQKGYDYLSSSPIACIKIVPISLKFAKDFSHRDVLGALMGLGIARNKIGDILIDEKTVYLFCLNDISDYIILNLYKIKNDNVKCGYTDIDKVKYEQRYEIIHKTVSSVRIDALCSISYNISRSTSNKLITEGNVFVNGKLITSNGYKITDNDVISVRHYGKLKFVRIINQTKKERFNIEILKYI